MMNLKEAIKESRRLEKEKGYHKIIYRVYDPHQNNNLIYVGIGGNGKRKGSGRLEEHNSNHYTNFRTRYVILEGVEEREDMTIKEMCDRWDNLKWDFDLYGEETNVKIIEEKLISEISPRYNIDGKVNVNQNILKFLN